VYTVQLFLSSPPRQKGVLIVPSYVRWKWSCYPYFS
jgi:hypothetical protein